MMADIELLPSLQEIREGYEPLPEPLTRWTGYLLNRVGQLSREYFDLLLAPLGITSRAYTIMALLTAEEPLSQVVMSERLRLDKNTMVTLLNGLEAGGLVERRRDPVDKRAHAVYLTQKGRECVPQATALLDQTEVEMLAPLSAEERDTFHQLLMKMV